MIIKQVPSFNGLKTAAVDGRGFNSLAEGMNFLAEAEKEARMQKSDSLTGPMKNGSWDAYRLVFYSDGSPAFSGEPHSDPYDLEAYLKSGFTISQTYCSASLDLADRREPATQCKDFNVTHWDGKNPENLLTGAHSVIMAAFAKAPFFSSLPVEKFIAAYRPLLKRVDPQLLLTARNQAGQIIAFLLAYPDANWPGGLIVKTYASLTPGAGRYLFNLIHCKGQQLGYRRAVHGLMREGNNHAIAASRRIGATKIFRRYALMEKRL